MKDLSSDEIRVINDELRASLCSKIAPTSGIAGRCVVSKSVFEMDIDDLAKLVQIVMEFSDFTEDNDPHKEHDFAFIDFNGEKFFWKFDYYNKDFDAYGHDFHVLTIARASEY